MHTGVCGRVRMARARPAGHPGAWRPPRRRGGRIGAWGAIRAWRSPDAARRPLDPRPGADRVTSSAPARRSAQAARDRPARDGGRGGAVRRATSAARARPRPSPARRRVGGWPAAVLDGWQRLPAAYPLASSRAAYRCPAQNGTRTTASAVTISSATTAGSPHPQQPGSAPGQAAGPWRWNPQVSPGQGGADRARRGGGSRRESRARSWAGLYPGPSQAGSHATAPACGPVPGGHRSQRVRPR